MCGVGRPHGQVVADLSAGPGDEFGPFDRH